MPTLRLLLICAASLLPHIASAELSGNEALAAIDSGGQDGEIITAYLLGNENGISWMNTVAEQNGPGFFCPPREIALRDAEIIGILRRAATEDPSIGDLPLGLALFLSMERAFPC